MRRTKNTISRSTFIKSMLVVLILSACASANKPPVVRSIMIDSDIKRQKSPIEKKYAQVLEVSLDSIDNQKLYTFVDKWLGTPYLYGGEDSVAIDCSYFAQNLYHNVYNSLLPRTAESQFSSKRTYLFKGRKYLKEGDLVFFKLPGQSKVTHVGIYLTNNRFVHSTARKSDKGKNGVQISKLDDPFWNRIFIAGGKVKIK